MTKGLSYTQRTLRALREAGHVAGIVERWNQYAGRFGVRQDLFGFIDLLYLDAGRRCIVAVQSTGPSGHASHRRKIREECNQEAHDWLVCNGRIELWSWKRAKVKRGGKAVRWAPRVEEITLEDLDNA